MKPILKKISRILIPAPVYVFFKGMKLIYSRKSYLVETGLLHSYRTDIPCKLDGNPVPWMNYNIISFLESRLNKTQNLFEFGSGYSTIFYSDRVNQVTSIEYNKDWYQRISSMVSDNVELIYQKNDIDGDYCRTIAKTHKQYDVVIIDGRDRVNCVKQAYDHLSENGVIILDDSQRNKYQAAFEFMAGHGFRHIYFEGLKPRGLGNDRTTVFYRDNNCFDI